MIYVGVDPSYSGTGVAYMDLDKKIVLLDTIRPGGTNQTYSDAINRALEIKVNILYREDYTHNYKTIMLEEPLVTSQMSSRLGMLSGVLSSGFLNDPIALVDKVYTINPNAVSGTNRGIRGYTSKTKKKISKEMALKYLEIFKDFGYEVIIYNKRRNRDGSMTKRVMTQDESEALILVIILLRYLNKLSPEIEQELLELNRGLNAKKTITELEYRLN